MKQFLRVVAGLARSVARISGMLGQRDAGPVTRAGNVNGVSTAATGSPARIAAADDDRGGKPAYMARALTNAGIAVFGYCPGAIGDRSSGDDKWQWSGAHFGIDGVDGPAGRTCLVAAVSEPDRQGMLSVLGLASAGASRSSAFRVMRHGGHAMDLFCEVYSEATTNDRPARVFGTIQDVTGQRRFEAELAGIVEHNQLLLATIDACPMSVTLADATRPDMPIIYANRMFEQMTGYRPDEAVGRNCRFLQGPETDRQTVADLRQAIAAGRRTEVQLVNYRKDGSQFLNRIMLAPFHDQTGHLTAYIGLQTDITLEIKQKNADVQRQKMEALGRMMGGVAHELNNMLQPVTLLGQHIRVNGFSAETGMQHLDVILECNTKAREIVGELLTFSRPTPRLAVLCDPVKLLDESMGILRQALPVGIVLSIRVDGVPPPILMDRTMFTQILLNLANNASAAMSGKGELTIVLDSPEPGAAENIAVQQPPFARFRITDTGCGMAKTTLERAFEPFFTTKPIGQGTGLGLAVIYRLVGEMNGTITLESEPGHGTTATIVFPGNPG